MWPIDGSSALYEACRQGSQQCVRLLLEVPSLCVDQQTVLGRPPLYIASREGHHQIVQLLIDHSNRMQKQAVRHSIINHVSKQGWFALLVAAENGHTETVQILLDNKVWLLSNLHLFLCVDDSILEIG